MIELFDNSMLNQFRQCPQKFKYRMVDNLVPIREGGVARQFGTAIHSALDYHHANVGKDTLSEALNIFRKAWAPFEGGDERDVRCEARGCAMITQYIERFVNEPFTVLHTEVGFSAELGQYIICGRMDAIIRWNLGFTGFCAFEHKVTGSKGYLVTRPNQQLDTYIWAIGQLMDEPAVGAYLNILYHTRKGVLENDFSRELTKREPEEIMLWEQDTITWCDTVNKCIKEDRWPRNTQQCGAYWRTCEYAALCNCTKKDYENVLVMQYKVDKWEPYPITKREVEV